MPIHSQTYDFGFPAQKLFGLYANALKNQADVRELQLDPSRLHMSWRVGEGSSFFTTESAHISVFFQPVAPFLTRMHVQARAGRCSTSGSTFRPRPKPRRGF